MNQRATIRVPVGAAFAHLADPSRLGDWMPEVTGPAEASVVVEADEVFTLTVGDGPARITAHGEVTACEPPWLIGYRLFIGPEVVTLRVACTTSPAGTQVELRQAGGTELAVALDRLARCLDGQAAAGTPQERRRNDLDRRFRL